MSTSNKLAAVFSTLALAACSPVGGEGAGDAGPGQSGAPIMGFSGMGNLPKQDQAATGAFLSSMGYPNEAAYYDDVMKKMAELSAPMARGHFFYVGNGQFHGEAALAPAAKAGVELYGWVNPAPPNEALDASFDAALEKLVKAYPGIRVWQLGNEPDLLWRDPALYPAFFKRAQPVIRAACPDCKIALAGISNQYDSSSQNFKLMEGFVDEIVKADLPGKPFDIFDFHYYKEAPSSTEITQAVSDFRTLLVSRGLTGVSLWCTETGLYSGDPHLPGMRPRTEEDQARDLPKLVAFMAAEGVERVYLWTLIESSGGSGAPGLFDLMGLVYNGIGDEVPKGIAAGTRKKAYVTYGLLARELLTVTKTSRPSPGVYRFDRPQGPAFVVFSEDGLSSVSLSGLDAATVQVKNLVPDSGGSTTSTEVAVSGGAVTLPVDSSPMLVTAVP